MGAKGDGCIVEAKADSRVVKDGGGSVGRGESENECKPPSRLEALFFWEKKSKLLRFLDSWGRNQVFQFLLETFGKV